VGRCEKCQETDDKERMAFFVSAVYVSARLAMGPGYPRDARDEYKGKNIRVVLDMTDDDKPFFRAVPPI